MFVYTWQQTMIKKTTSFCKEREREREREKERERERERMCTTCVYITLFSQTFIYCIESL